jgi:hypothetical protein
VHKAVPSRDRAVTETTIVLHCIKFAIVVLQSTSKNSIDCEIRLAKQRLFRNRKKPLLSCAHSTWWTPAACQRESAAEFHNEDMTWERWWNVFARSWSIIHARISIWSWFDVAAEGHECCGGLHPQSSHYECDAHKHRDEWFAEIVLRTTRHDDTFELARVLRKARHDIVHEAKLVVNDVDTSGVDKITCTQKLREEIYDSWLIKCELCVRGMARAVRGAHHDVYYKTED